MFGMDVKLSTASTSAEVQALDIVLLLISDKHLCSHDTLTDVLKEFCCVLVMNSCKLKCVGLS